MRRTDPRPNVNEITDRTSLPSAVSHHFKDFKDISPDRCLRKGDIAIIIITNKRHRQAQPAERRLENIGILNIPGDDLVLQLQKLLVFSTNRRAAIRQSLSVNKIRNRSLRPPGNELLLLAALSVKGWGMIFMFSKKNASKQAYRRETNELKRQIELSKTAILSAQYQFEQVVDPTLVDCYIYELNAAQLRYQFLLRRLKKRELQEV